MLVSRTFPKAVVVGISLIVLASGCAKSPPVAQVLVPVAPDVDALAVDGAGDLYYADRITGDVFLVPGSRPQPAQRVAHVDVSSNEGQRGLLGLAIDAGGRVFGSYTAPGANGRVTVAQLLPGPTRVLWNGPVASDLANGGHIAFSPTQRLTIGIGDLTDRSKLDDPNAPNGKLLSLDPNGAADQNPEVISSNWNNPFAFTYRPDGSLYVGDNEPGNGSERLARADKNNGATDVAHIGAHKVASGLAATTDGSLWECTFLGKTLQRYRIGTSGVPTKAGSPVARDCSLGVVTLANGRLAYSTGTAIKVVATTK